MKILLVFCACLLTVIGQQCPDSTWTMLSDKKRCIKVFTNPLPVITGGCQMYCYEKQLGYLGHILSSADNTQFATIAKRDGGGKTLFWIGLFRTYFNNLAWHGDGATVNYTNWKSGSSPSSATYGYDCVLFDTTTSKWIANNDCFAVSYPFICQTAAFVRDTGNLLVREGREENIQTEGFAYPSGKGLEAFTSDKNVLPISDIAASYQILVTMKYRGNANTNITFYDAATGGLIKKYEGSSSTASTWMDVILQTHSWYLKMIAYSERLASLAYNITFSIQPLFCRAECIDVASGGKGNVQSFDYDRIKDDERCLSPYICQKILRAPSGHTIYLDVSGYAGTASYIDIIDDTTNSQLYRIEDSSNWNYSVMKSFNTYTNNVRIEAAASAAARIEGCVAFSINYITVPKVCQQLSYIPSTAKKMFYTPQYPMPLSDFSCTSLVKTGGTTTKVSILVAGEISGDAKVTISSADTGALIKQYASTSGTTVKMTGTVTALAGHNVRIMTYAGKQGRVYHSTQYYY